MFWYSILLVLCSHDFLSTPSFSLFVTLTRTTLTIQTLLFFALTVLYPYRHWTNKMLNYYSGPKVLGVILRSCFASTEGT